MTTSDARLPSKPLLRIATKKKKLPIIMEDTVLVAKRDTACNRERDRNVLHCVMYILRTWNITPHGSVAGLLKNAFASCMFTYYMMINDVLFCFDV